MITYRKTWFDLHLLFRLYGSAIVRTLPWGMLAALQTGLLYLAPNHSIDWYYGGRVPAYAVFATAVALLVIFRQNAGYGRFHEGRTRLQAMSAAWLDAFTKAISFDGGSIKDGQRDQASQQFRLECVHYFSLLHGVAVQFLRSDWELNNLAPHDPSNLPTFDSAYCPGYKPSKVDYFVLRSTPLRRLPLNAAFALPVVGEVTEDERELLGQLAAMTRLQTMLKYDNQENLGRADRTGRLVKQHLFTSSQGQYDKGAAERVYQVYYWAHEAMRLRMAEGGLDMPAPIVSQLFGALQKGIEAFEHCRYLCDTPFPFAWAQMLCVMLLCLQFTVPFMVVTAYSDVALGILTAMMMVQAYWALNEVSRELEDPYCFEPNDIPLARLQWQFNERLLAQSNSRMPNRGGASVQQAPGGGGSNTDSDKELPV